MSNAKRLGADGMSVPIEDSAMRDMACEPYEQKAYTVPAYCIHEDKFYSLKQNISAESWNSNHWEETTLAEILATHTTQISTLNSSLAQLLTWKYLDKKIGNTDISLSGVTYSEILLVAKIDDSGNSFSCVIPKADIPTGTAGSAVNYYRFGGYAANANYGQATCGINTSIAKLQNLYWLGTDKTSTSSLTVYYR